MMIARIIKAYALMNNIPEDRADEAIRLLAVTQSAPLRVEQLLKKQALMDVLGISNKEFNSINPPVHHVGRHRRYRLSEVLGCLQRPGMQLKLE